MGTIAQLPAASPEGVGIWIAGAACVVGFIGAALYAMNQWKRLHEKPPETPTEDRFVTHGQFDAFKNEVRVQLTDFRRELKEEMKASNAKLDADVTELTKYLHESMHRNNNFQQTMVSSLSWIKGVMASKAAGSAKAEIEDHQ